jgi:hypothetical protein
MKDGAIEILGKTIRAVVIKEAEDSPRSQLFLVFEDGTHFEFYCSRDTIHPAGGVDPGGLDAVRRYMSGRSHIVFEAYPKSLI